MSRNEVALEDMRTSPIKGFIDTYEAGQFMGWAYDPENPDHDVKVSIYSGQTLVGEGVANMFRQDLKEAGIGTGTHAFVLRALAPLETAEDGHVSLLDAETGEVIHVLDIQTHGQSDWIGHIQSVDGYVISGSFSSNTLSPSQLRYFIYIDNLRVGEDHATPGEKGGKYRFSFSIPGEYCDGLPHVISVVTADNSGNASYVTVLRPMLTPWQYLARDEDCSGQIYGGMPGTVSRRYAIFHNRIRTATAEKDLEQIERINTIFSVLNEGYEGRKEFPHLYLPQVSDPDVSIIIPVHNKFELTYYCLASLIFSENACSFEVVIVDDCSTDKTQNITEYVSNARVIVNDENLGFLRNCNKAADVAKARKQAAARAGRTHSAREI